jgi:hypothetical protein
MRVTEAISLVRKTDKQINPLLGTRRSHPEEAPSELFWPGAGFDEPTLSGQAGQQTLSQALDEYESAPPARRKSMEPGIYQQIIRFRSKLAKGMDEDERHALERRIAAYSNSLVKRK